MDNGNGLGVADVAALSGGGFGNGIEGLLYLAVIAFMFGGGNIFGGGNNGNANAIQNDINRGFDNQNLQAQTRDLTAAVNAQGAAAIAATNQTFHDSLAAMQGLYNETARDIAALAVGQANLQASQAQCCCETKQLIMQNNYDGALRDAQTNANFTAQIQSVKDMIAQDKIAGLEAQISALQLQNALAGVVRYPMTTVYNVPSPCFAGGCGCNG